MDGYHLYFDSPPVVFKARVNGEPTSYPATELSFDGVTAGAFGDILPDMLLTLGTTEGASDLGSVRVHAFPDSDSIPLGRISRGRERGTLDIQDNAYITVYDDYRPWAKIPKMVLDPETGEDITTYKDANIPVLSYNEEIPPVANSGPHFADYIDADTEVITVTFPMNGVDISFAIAEGATITDYLWDVVDGTITVGSETDASITATFPAGRRWVGLTVTDSNGKVHTSRTFVLAVDPADDVTYQDWASINCSLQPNGQTIQVVLNDALDRSLYPDGCFVLLWKDAPSSPGDRSHMKFSGWMVSEEWNITARKLGYSRGTTVTCGDLGVWLDFLPGFPQALERPDEGAEAAWEYMPNLDMNKALNYLYTWHTTGVALGDFILPEGGDNYKAMRLDSNGSSIYDQMNTLSRKMVPKHTLCCTPQGQLIFQREWMEMDEGERPTASYILTEDNCKDVRTRYNPYPKAHLLKTGAIVSTEEWILLGGEKTLPLAFAVAPGDAFGQGTNEVIEGDGITLSQEELNIATGHRYARYNAKYAPFDIGIAAVFDWWELAPAYFNRIQLNLSAAYAAQRGLDFTSAFGQLQKLTIQLTSGKTGYARNVSVSWERETEGLPAATHIPEQESPPSEDDIEVPAPIPTTPPGVTAPDLVAGVGIDGFIYRTENFQDATPTWDRVDTGIADTIYSWVVDPFSPGYLNGSGTINGWIVNDTDIYRVEDIFGSCDTNSVYTFDIATDAADFHWRQLSASFGAYFSEGNNPWLMCVSYYHTTPGAFGTKVVYSTDAGATWSEENWISDQYDDIPPRFNPIALWMSPRTPGLAYTIAYGEGAGDPDKLPIWGVFKNGASEAIYSDPSSKAIFESQLVLIGDTPELDEGGTLVMIPPANTVRVKIEGSWSAAASLVDTGLPDMVLNMSIDDPATLTAVEDFTYVNPSPPTPDGSDNKGGVFELEWTLGGAVADWPVNRTSILTNPLTAPGTPAGARFEITAHGNGETGENQIATLKWTVRVTEIEFDGGEIYNPPVASTTLFLTGDWGATWVKPGNMANPGSSMGGTIHVPWDDNLSQNTFYYGALENANLREFRLKKWVAGVETDVSPTDGSISYGVNRGPFGVRTFDGAGGKQFVLAAVVGNDTEGTGADDQHAVYISDDGAATWAEVVAPIADSSAPTNRPAFEAAFGAGSEQEIFIWGPPDYMSYSTDFGATVLDKSGNLNSLGPCPGFIGIAGGPG